MTDDRETATLDSPCEVGKECVPGGGILALLALALAATILLTYTLIAAWPESQPTTQGAETQETIADTPIAFLSLNFTLSSDARIFLIVAVAGALGGIIHTLRSLSWYVGNRYLKWSWVPFYVLLPIIGAGLATVFYLVLRAGLFSPSTATDDVNVYGFAAIAALVGVFSEQALEKLREVFSSILSPAPAGRDTAPARNGGPVAVTGPARAVTATEAVLTGTVKPNGLDTEVQFVFGLSAAYGEKAEVRTVAASELEATLEAAISGLSPSRTYHYRIEARNAAGETLGEGVTFETQG